MALEEIALELSTDGLPKEIQAAIDVSDNRIDALFATAGNKRVPKYLPSDPVLFYKALEYLTDSDLPLGRVFCEWGCGFGICACLAAKLGYEAFGIEIDPEMAAAAQRLAKDLNAQVGILETSYIPAGYDSYSGMGGEYLVKSEDIPSRDAGTLPDLRYDGMNCEIAAIDVFFVYPWPMEQEFVQNLFAEIAVEGAILISYHKAGEIFAFRKTGEDDFSAEQEWWE